MFVLGYICSVVIHKLYPDIENVSHNVKIARHPRFDSQSRNHCIFIEIFYFTHIPL